MSEVGNRLSTGGIISLPTTKGTYEMQMRYYWLDVEAKKIKIPKFDMEKDWKNIGK